MRQPSPKRRSCLADGFRLSEPLCRPDEGRAGGGRAGRPVLDLCHQVAPQDCFQAAFFLAASLPWLPPGSVAVAVVDPGVGTQRRVALSRRTDGASWPRITEF